MQTPTAIPVIPTINSIHPCEEGIVITDTNGYIWLNGINAESQLTSMNPTINPRSFKTPLKLEPSEAIIEAHRFTDLLSIYTSSKRLIILRVLKQYQLADPDPEIPQNQDLRNIDFALKPFEDVTDVAFMYNTVLFHCSYGHCIFNHKLVSVNKEKQRYSVDHGIVYEPVLRDETLVCYRVVLPSSYPVMQYHRNFVHGVLESNHIILSASPYDHFSLNVSQFKDDGTLANSTNAQLYVNAISPVTAIIDGITYYSRGPTEPLKPCKYCGQGHIMNKDTYDQCISFVKNGYLRDFEPPLLLTVNQDEIVGHDKCSHIMISNDTSRMCEVEERIMYLNVKYFEWWKKQQYGIVAFRKERNELLFFTTFKFEPSPFMVAIDSLKTPGNCTFTIYKIMTPQPIIAAWAGDLAIVAQTRDYKYYRIELTNRAPCWELVLSSDCSPVDSSLVTYPYILDDPQSQIYITSEHDCFIVLANLLENNTTDNKCPQEPRKGYPFPSSFSVTHDSVQGPDATQLFIKKAMTRFAELCLRSHGLGSKLDCDSIKSLTPCGTLCEDIIDRLGQAIHLSVIASGSYLSLSSGLPFSVLVLLKRGKPSIADFEYFVRKYFPGIAELIFALKNNLTMLNICGYSSYRECLQDLLQYDPNSNSEENTISEIMARAILKYASIPNLDVMNLPALDFYFTGPCTVNKPLNKDTHSSDAAYQFMHKLLHSVPESQLDALLSIWG